MFAVLLERVRWSVAFKTVVFMPMAISLFAAGVIWRVMDEKDPEIGAVNASIAVVADAVDPPGALPDAQPSTEDLTGSAESGLVLQRPVEPGDVAQLGLTAIPPKDVPEGSCRRAPRRRRRARSGASCGATSSPAAAGPASIEQGELGIPGVTVELREPDGGSIGKTKTGDDGSFRFEEVRGPEAQLAIGKETFEEPFAGVSWLGRGPDHARRSCSPTSGSGRALRWS